MPFKIKIKRLFKNLPSTNVRKYDLALEI